MSVVLATVWALVLCVSSAATAAEPDRHGYWRQDGIGALGSPAVDVPDDGLLVSRGLADEAAVSALALDVGAAEVEAVVLRLASRDASDRGDVVACRATSNWNQPDGPGAWGDRPDHDCSESVAPEVDGDEWVFAVGSLVRDGRLDVVFVPAEGIEPFSIAFEPPTAATVLVRADDAAGPSVGPSVSPSVPATVPAPVTSGSGSGSSAFDPPSIGGSGFAPPSAPDVAAPPADGDGATDLDTDQPVAEDAPSGEIAGAAVDTSLAGLSDRPGGPAMTLVGATAVAAAAVWVWRRSRATAELALTHPLAGLPSLAGDSVRDAGRALVDDAAPASPEATAPTDATEVLA